MSADSIRARRLMAVAALVGLLLRLAFAFAYWIDKPLTHDEREYLALASSLSAGKGFTYDALPDSSDTARFGRAPGYPVFLAIVGSGVREVDATPSQVKIAQSIVGAIGVWLIGAIARRAGGPRAGLAAAFIAAVYPPLVWICAYVFSEALFSTAALSAVLLLNQALDRMSTPAPTGKKTASAWGVAAGIATGGAMLIRPAMAFFVPVAVVWLMRRRPTLLAVTFVIGALVIVAPWTARNVGVYHRLVFIASEGGVTFWTGNHPLATGEGDMAANPDIKVSDIAFRRRHPGLTQEELEPLYYREAVAYLATHPMWWLGLLVKKAFYTVVPAGRSYALHSPLYRTSSIASYLIVLPLGVLGAAMWRRRPHPPESLFPLALSAVIVCILFFPQERFRIPVIDPTLIICAGVWYAHRAHHTIET
ncbi:MAG: glycosyltransferase family 39 protein [Vicinamibacterales bacterium]